MFGKREKSAPYEVMRPGSRETRDHPTLPWGSAGTKKASGRSFSGAGGKMGDWLTGGEPVVLRLAKGMAVLIAGGVVLVIVLAYWVGYARGGAAADAHHQRELTSARTPLRGIPPISTDFQTPINTVPGSVTSAGSSTDPRTVGLNYLIIADYPYADAQRLRQFLAEREVETFLISSHNAQFVLVVGMEGFAHRVDRDRYEKRLRRLGRKWRTYNGNRGDELQTMWWDKHEGE